MAAKLCPVQLHNIAPKIIELLKPFWPKTILYCYALDKAMRWEKQFPEMNPILLVPDGRWEKGDFVLIEPETTNNILMHTFEEDLSALKNMICDSEYIDWTKDTTVGPLLSKYHKMAEEIFIEKKMERLADDVNTKAYWMSIADTQKLNVTDLHDAYFGPIDHELHAKLIDDTWPHKYPGSLEIIKYMLKSDPGVGIYTKEKHELVCWILRDEYGTPGLLFTQPLHRGKGYGKAASANMAKRVADHGFPPNVFIVTHNKTSSVMFEKLGFKQYDFVSWYFVKQK